LFKMMAGVDLVHVPYTGNPYADLIGGQVQSMFSPIPASIGYVRSGQLRALAVGSTARIAILPDVPTVAEVLPGYDASGWHGICAPKNTSADICRNREQGGERRPRRCRVQAEAWRSRRHCGADDAREVRQIHRRRNRQVGEGE
jgi:hypothetical protein